MTDLAMTTASLPTLRDVARRAGVSIRTVRRVIAEEPYVAATVREKVRRILDATGYSPNPIARSLRTRTTTDILALVVAESPELSDFQVARILALESALWSAGFSLNVRFLRHGESTNGRALLQGSLARRPAGVAVFLAGHRDPRRLDSLLAGTRLPCVVVDAPAPAADHLTVDRPGGVQAAVRHLADRGRRRIAYLGQNGLSPRAPRTRSAGPASRPAFLHRPPRPRPGKRRTSGEPEAEARRSPGLFRRNGAGTSGRIA
jgi:LacI family transcriptional regulator